MYFPGSTFANAKPRLRWLRWKKLMEGKQGAGVSFASITRQAATFLVRIANLLLLHVPRTVRDAKFDASFQKFL